MSRKPILEERPKGDSIRVLGHIFDFLSPYRLRVIAALVSLVAAAGAVLAIGQALRRVVDLVSAVTARFWINTFWRFWES